MTSETESVWFSSQYLTWFPNKLLLDLPDAGLAVIAGMFRDLRHQRLTPGVFRRVSRTVGDTVITAVATLDHTADALYKHVAMRAVLEKYRRKARKSVGFGLRPADPTVPFECAIWGDEEWTPDPGLERILREEPLITPAPGWSLPGRNAPCVCGSGRKFKHCCLPKYEAARRRA